MVPVEDTTIDDEQGTQKRTTHMHVIDDVPAMEEADDDRVYVSCQTSCRPELTLGCGALTVKYLTRKNLFVGKTFDRCHPERTPLQTEQRHICYTKRTGKNGECNVRHSTHQYHHLRGCRSAGLVEMMVTSTESARHLWQSSRCLRGVRERSSAVGADHCHNLGGIWRIAGTL